MNIAESVPFAGFILLIVMIGAKVIFLHRKGFRTASGKRKINPSAWFFMPLFTLIMLLWIMETAREAFNSDVSFLPAFMTNYLYEAYWLKIVGITITVMGLLLMGTTLLHFKSSLRFGLDRQNKGVLITSGIFSCTRNPFFLSLIICFTGTALLLPNLFFIAYAVLAAVGIHLFILREEKFMHEAYGDEYHSYTKKVRRYF